MTGGKAVLASLSAIAVLSLGALVGILTESEPNDRLEQLGFAGPAVYVAAVGSEGVVPEGLSEQLREFAVAHDVSVGFTPTSSGMVTVWDPSRRVVTSRGPVADLLDRVAAPAPSGPARAEAPAGLLSDSVHGLDQLVSAGGAPVAFDRVDLGDITFRGDRLTAFVNPPAQPFGHGYYLFLGASDPTPIVAMLSEAGMDVLEVDQPSSLGGYLRSPFGVVALVAVASVAFSAAIAAGIRAVSARPRLQVMALIGAPRRRLAAEVVGRLLPSILFGTAVGVALLATAQVAWFGAALSSGAAQLRGLALTMGVVAMTWAAIVTLVAWSEVRGCRSAQRG